MKMQDVVMQYEQYSKFQTKFHAPHSLKSLLLEKKEDRKWDLVNEINFIYKFSEWERKSRADWE